MQSLLQSIRNNSQAYTALALNWRFRKNELKGNKFSELCVQLRSTHNKVLLEAKTLIEGQLDFLPEFSQLLKSLFKMQQSIDYKIQSGTDYGSNYHRGQYFVDDIQYISTQAKKIQIDAKFLNQNWDIQFLKKLYKQGMSIQSIIKIRNENIRQVTVKHLTDQDIQALGIKKIGDVIMLKNLR